MSLLQVPMGKTSSLPPPCSDPAQEQEKEIATQFRMAEMRAGQLRQVLEHLHARLSVVMKPAGPQPDTLVGQPLPPETEVGQRIRSLAQEFDYAADVVGDMLQRLELQ